MARRFDKVSTKIWCADDLGAAELLRGRFADFSYDVHTHDKACFALLTRGAIRIRMRGGEFVARAGDLYTIDAAEPHARWPVDDDGCTPRPPPVAFPHLPAPLHAAPASPQQPAPAGPTIPTAHP